MLSESFGDNICIDDLIFIEKQHSFVIVAPGETLHIEYLLLEGEGTLHYDAIPPEKDLVCGTGNAEGVFLATPLCHPDLGA